FLPGASEIAKRSAPSRPQDPLAATPGTSQRDRGAPPSARIVFSFPSAKKLIERLSGDQKGAIASSVPASGWEESASRRWIQSWRLPSDTAGKARRRPLGGVR